MTFSTAIRLVIGAQNQLDKALDDTYPNRHFSTIEAGVENAKRGLEAAEAEVNDWYAKQKLI